MVNSGSTALTASASSSVQPPTKTLSRRKRPAPPAAAGRGSRRWCRAASAAAPADRARRPSAAAAGARAGPAAPAGGRTLIRAAASSIASGRPSSRRQMAGDGRRRSQRSGRSPAAPACARSTNSATAGIVRQLRTVCGRSRCGQRQGRHAETRAPPRTWSGSRLVARIARRHGRQQRRRGPVPRRGPARSCPARAGAVGMPGTWPASPQGLSGRLPHAERRRRWSG